MGTPDFAGSEAAFIECLRDTHVQRREFITAFDYSCWRTSASDIDAERFDALLEAIEKKDIAAADTLLRVWGIR